MEDEEWLDGYNSGRGDAEYEINHLKLMVRNIAEFLNPLIRLELIQNNEDFRSIMEEGMGWKKPTDNYPHNPADDPKNCLACMGATGSAVQHTCKTK